MALFIDENPLDTHSPWGWMWVRPVEGGIELYTLSDTREWELKHTIPSVDAEGTMSPQNLQIHNLNITGNLFYNGDNGANADVTSGGIHMVVKEGIVTTLETV